jgi:hypothetical protein
MSEQWFRMESMLRFSRVFILIVLLVGGVFALKYFMRIEDESHTSTYVNSVLAVRGFRHKGIEVLTGDSAAYQVNKGEEFKVTWKIENATENSQIIYQGPEGVGGGLVSIPYDLIPSSSNSPFLTFNPRQAGTARISLTVTGSGPDGIYTLTSNVIVTIK